MFKNLFWIAYEIPEMPMNPHYTTSDINQIIPDSESVMLYWEYSDRLTKHFTFGSLRYYAYYQYVPFSVLVLAKVKSKKHHKIWTN